MSLLLSSLFCSTNSSHELPVFMMVDVDPIKTMLFSISICYCFPKTKENSLFFSSLLFVSFFLKISKFKDFSSWIYMARETYTIVYLVQSQRAYEVIRCFWCFLTFSFTCISSISFEGHLLSFSHHVYPQSYTITCVNPYTRWNGFDF